MSTVAIGSLLAHTRSGHGEPLVLLHGLGSHRGVWDPVVPMLAEHHEVLAIDLPGFGESPPLLPRDEPSPQRLAEAVAATLDQLGITRPHLVGNSLGGWIALELAQRQPVASVTLVSPAGLWRRHAPVYARASLLATWRACRYGGRVIGALSRWSLARRLMFWQVFGHPERLTPADARRNVAAMANGRGFRPTLDATRRRRFVRTGAIDVPVTLTFGTRDRILLRRQARFTGELPEQTVAIDLRGGGHVPTWDVPAELANIILSTTARARS